MRSLKLIMVLALIGLAALLAFGFGPPAEARTIAVASQSQFDAVLKNAGGGDVIQLADGKYSLNASNIAYASPVTVQGSTKAVFSAYAALTSVSNLTFRGVTFKGSAGMANGAYILKPTNTKNIAFIGCNFAGVDGTGTGIYSKTAGNSNLTIDGGHTYGLMDGHTLFSVIGLTVQNVDFYALGADSIKISNIRNGSFLRNHVHDAKHAAGAHPDFLQIQGANDNIVANDNLIEGNTQGIDNFGFAGSKNTNFKVLRNRIVQGGYANAIGLNNITTIAVNDNQVTSGTSGRAIIQVTGTGVTKTGNTIDGKAM